LWLDCHRLNLACSYLIFCVKIYYGFLRDLLLNDFCLLLYRAYFRLLLAFLNFSNFALFLFEWGLFLRLTLLGWRVLSLLFFLLSFGSFFRILRSLLLVVASFILLWMLFYLNLVFWINLRRTLFLLFMFILAFLFVFLLFLRVLFDSHNFNIIALFLSFLFHNIQFLKTLLFIGNLSLHYYFLFFCFTHFFLLLFINL